REGCDEFHDFEASSSRSPCRSWCPTIAEPSPLLVQFLHVRSSPAANAVPSGCVPVRISCMLGWSPRPLTGWPFSLSDVCLFNLLLALWRSATLVATTSPLAFFHGPFPM